MGLLRNWLRGFANHYDQNSLISRIRRKRMSYFKDLLKSLPESDSAIISILDIGGDPIFWDEIGLDSKKFHLILVNLEARSVRSENMQCFIGDARNLSMIDPDSVDVVFSNSVIEHVGDIDDQRAMVREIFRMNAPIFLQTPNYWFPMEPHFLVPFFQFLPVWIRTWMLTRFNLGAYNRIKDWSQARTEVNQIQLLSRRQLSRMFQDSKIERERLVGLTSGLIVTQGWPNDSINFRSSQK